MSRALEELRQAAVSFAPSRLANWFEGVKELARSGHAAPRATFDHRAIDAELLAAATSDAAVARQADADADAPRPQAVRAAARKPGDEDRGDGRTYTGEDAHERFGAACRTALENLQRAGAPSG